MIPRREMSATWHGVTKYFSLLFPDKLDDYYNADLQRFHLIKVLQAPPDKEGRYVFGPLTASTAMRTLNNQRHAGAYVYGRRLYRRVVDGTKTIQGKREDDDWLVCIPNAHPGYISWEPFRENLKILEINGRGYEVARSSPPREEAALLQGRAVCGRCGKHFRVRYATRRGRQEAWYVCERGYTARGEPNCQSIAGPQSIRPLERS